MVMENFMSSRLGDEFFLITKPMATKKLSLPHEIFDHHMIGDRMLLVAKH
jgi:hypothetical protein